MITEDMKAQLSAEQKASDDAYNLIACEQLKTKAAEVRRNPKRFAAAVKYIEKENEERRKAVQKENAARASAVKK